MPLFVREDVSTLFPSVLIEVRALFDIVTVCEPAGFVFVFVVFCHPNAGRAASEPAMPNASSLFIALPSFHLRAAHGSSANYAPGGSLRPPRIASAERSTSSSLVAQFEIDKRIAAMPCHVVPAIQQVPSRCA